MVLGRLTGKPLDGRIPRERFSSLQQLAARYGFRRVEHVRLVCGDGSILATVTGIIHRYPRSIRVPLSVASQLVAAGAPLTIDRTNVVASDATPR